MVNKVTALATIVVIAAVAIALGFIFVSQQKSGSYRQINQQQDNQPTYTAKFQIVGKDYRDTLEGLNKVAFVEVTVKNIGNGTGGTMVHAKVQQGSSFWEKNTGPVYLEPGQTNKVTLKFEEVHFWSLDAITYSVWLGES